MPTPEIGDLITCLVGEEKGKQGKIIGVLDTFGADYPEFNEQYVIEFESNAHGIWIWHRLLFSNEFTINGGLKRCSTSTTMKSCTEL